MIGKFISCRIITGRGLQFYKIKLLLIIQLANKLYQKCLFSQPEYKHIMSKDNATFSLVSPDHRG